VLLQPALAATLFTSLDQPCHLLHAQPRAARHRLKRHTSRARCTAFSICWAGAITSAHTLLLRRLQIWYLREHVQQWPPSRQLLSSPSIKSQPLSMTVHNGEKRRDRYKLSLGVHCENKYQHTSRTNMQTHPTPGCKAAHCMRVMLSLPSCELASSQSLALNLRHHFCLCSCITALFAHRVHTAMDHHCYAPTQATSGQPNVPHLAANNEVRQHLVLRTAL
jgi:hypothetical protein